MADKAGFKVKDVLVSMDGQPIQDREVFNRLMSRKQWGDGATFVVKRGDQEVTLKAFFRRQPPSPARRDAVSLERASRGRSASGRLRHDLERLQPLHPVLPRLRRQPAARTCCCTRLPTGSSNCHPALALRAARAC